MIYHLTWSLCNQLRFIETEIRYDGGQSMFGKDKHNSVNKPNQRKKKKKKKTNKHTCMRMQFPLYNASKS